MPAAFTADDGRAFGSGTHIGVHHVLGAHPGGGGTVSFGVWAPNARRVHVVGEMNGWETTDDAALAAGPSGVWLGELVAAIGQRYKFRITPGHGEPFDKADPFAFATEEPPGTASVIAGRTYAWQDGPWMAERGARIARHAPVSIYEVHLGSWRHEPGGYRAIAPRLADHVAGAGFTHIELLPITEHPFYGSWGYLTSGYFAPTARYGSPADLKAFIDHFHRRGIGVLLDWVPSHFPDDPHGLARFDGSPLFEHPDPRLGHHPDWDSCVFDYGRPEVRSFLLSSAHYWIDEYHADGLRVDAVASMLHRDYSRAEGEWIPNVDGGNEYVEAVEFVRELNRSLADRFPDIVVIAEESTAWPGVTAPIDQGGLGFSYKWDMGWMHDTLQYQRRPPELRSQHANDLTFRSVYRTSEHYVLPLSHDEVAPAKGSLLGAMPGDRWQQRANLRLLLGYQWTTPGKKLLFMGGEFGVPTQWDHDTELPWSLLDEPEHAGILDLVADLNRLYRATPALHLGDSAEDGFAWVVADDDRNCVFAFERRAADHHPVLVAANFGTKPREGYRIGVSVPGTWRPLLDTDHSRYGGTGTVNAPVEADIVSSHGRSQSIAVRLGPLALSVLIPDS